MPHARGRAGARTRSRARGPVRYDTSSVVAIDEQEHEEDQRTSVTTGVGHRHGEHETVDEDHRRHERSIEPRDLPSRQLHRADHHRVRERQRYQRHVEIAGQCGDDGQRRGGEKTHALQDEEPVRDRLDFTRTARAGAGHLKRATTLRVARTGQPAVAPADELMCGKEQEYRKGEDRHEHSGLVPNQERARWPPDGALAAPRASPMRSGDALASLPGSAASRRRPGRRVPEGEATGVSSGAACTRRTAGAGDPAAEGSAPLGGVGAVEAETASVPAAPVVAGPPPTVGPPVAVPVLDVDVHDGLARLGCRHAAGRRGRRRGLMRLAHVLAGVGRWHRPADRGGRETRTPRRSCRVRKRQDWTRRVRDRRGWTCHGRTGQAWRSRNRRRRWPRRTAS